MSDEKETVADTPQDKKLGDAESRASWMRKYMLFFKISKNGGNPAELTDDVKRHLSKLIREDLGPEYSCEACALNERVNIFPKGKELSLGDIEKIKDDKRPVSEIAEAYGTSKQLIWKIKKKNKKNT